jgi:xanthine dehydrogenase YagT iron-sulfur-binding subunit
VDHLSITNKQKPDEQIAETVSLSIRINGTRHDLQVAPRTTLLDLLREYLGFTGTKKGCDHGQCGVCTVLANGNPINSCLTLAVMRDGQEITTIEGIGLGNDLHPIQQAFIDHDAFQCGYCTPGQICLAVGLLNAGLLKTTEDIRELMSGTLCRCAAYPNIVTAVREIANGQLQGSKE